jgi:hypothetical protein
MRMGDPRRSPIRVKDRSGVVGITVVELSKLLSNALSFAVLRMPFNHWYPGAPRKAPAALLPSAQMSVWKVAPPCEGPDQWPKWKRKDDQA